MSNLDKLLNCDKESPKTFIDTHPYIKKEPSVLSSEDFLYHGVRSQEYLEKFIYILKTGKILAGKYLDDYYNYSDNCNEGEYVSLLEKSDESENEFNVFIEPNICFLITPFISAYKTIYIPYDLWEYMMEVKPVLQNRFSYAKGEYHIKDYVELSQVRAIGIPYRYTEILSGVSYANKLLNDVLRVMNMYGYDFIVVDTSNDNKILYNPTDRKTIFKTYVNSYLKN